MKPVLVMLLIFGCVLTGCAAKREPAMKEEVKTAAAEPAKELSHEEMMEAWKKAGEVREEHRRLSPMVGKWEVTMKHWMEPGKEPTVDKGTAEARWVLDGRFVEQTYKGKAFGKPFEGRWILGHDNTKGKYTSLWMDSHSTGVFEGTGEFDQHQNALNTYSTMTCPIKGEMKTRSTLKFISPGEQLFEMFGDHEGKEVKMLEINYKKKKG